MVVVYAISVFIWLCKIFQMSLEYHLFFTFKMWEGVGVGWGLSGLNVFTWK